MSYWASCCCGSEDIFFVKCEDAPPYAVNLKGPESDFEEVAGRDISLGQVWYHQTEEGECWCGTFQTTDPTDALVYNKTGSWDGPQDDCDDDDCDACYMYFIPCFDHVHSYAMATTIAKWNTLLVDSSGSALSIDSSNASTYAGTWLFDRKIGDNNDPSSTPCCPEEAQPCVAFCGYLSPTPPEGKSICHDKEGVLPECPWCTPTSNQIQVIDGIGYLNLGASNFENVDDNVHCDEYVDLTTTPNAEPKCRVCRPQVCGGPTTRYLEYRGQKTIVLYSKITGSHTKTNSIQNTIDRVLSATGSFDIQLSIDYSVWLSVDVIQNDLQYFPDDPSSPAGTTIRWDEEIMSEHSITRGCVTINNSAADIVQRGELQNAWTYTHIDNDDSSKNFTEEVELLSQSVTVPPQNESLHSGRYQRRINLFADGRQFDPDPNTSTTYAEVCSGLGRACVMNWLQAGNLNIQIDAEVKETRTGDDPGTYTESRSIPMPLQVSTAMVDKTATDISCCTTLPQFEALWWTDLPKSIVTLMRNVRNAIKPAEIHVQATANALSPQEFEQQIKNTGTESNPFYSYEHLFRPEPDGWGFGIADVPYLVWDSTSPRYGETVDSGFICPNLDGSANYPTQWKFNFNNTATNQTGYPPGPGISSVFSRNHVVDISITDVPISFTCHSNLPSASCASGEIS